MGNHVNNVQLISVVVGHKLLTNAYIPPSDYDFRIYSKGRGRFRNPWLQQYQWRAYAYSPLLSLCANFVCSFCNLSLCQFISAACIMCNDFHKFAQKLNSNVWHCQAQEDINKFPINVKYPERRVDSLLANDFNSVVISKRANLAPISSSIIFCAT